MTLKIEESDGGNLRFTLTRCPACGRVFDEKSGRQKRTHFLKEHLPEDFGLSELNE